MENIEHKGVVVGLEPKKVRVEVLVESACAQCHLKGACRPSESDQRIMDVATDDSSLYEVGQEVVLSFRQEKALTLVAMAYVIPVVVAIVMVAILVENGISEGVAGLSSVATLGVYFIVLHFFMNYYKNKLDIKILSQ